MLALVIGLTLGIALSAVCLETRLALTRAGAFLMGLTAGGVIVWLWQAHFARREADLEAVLSASLDPIVVTDHQGKIVFASEALERVFGWEPSELVGRGVEILMPEPYRSAHAGYVEEFWSTGRRHILGRARELAAVRRDGAVFPCEVSISMARPHRKRAAIFIGMLRDISARKRAESELEEARTLAEEANRTKSRFIAQMSHEIRTPLTTILGLAEELCSPDVEPLDQRETGRTILQSGNHLLAILNDILDMSKIEAGRLEIERVSADPSQIVTEVSSFMKGRFRAKGIELRVDLDEDLPDRVMTDPTRVRQILMNLLSNALKFTEHGEVRLDASWIERGDGGVARLAVSDTGIGMDEEERRRVLEPFVQAQASTTRRFGGTGLGLAIVNHLTRALDGRLSIDSRPGMGSTFTVELPLERASAPRGGSGGETPSRQRFELRALLVDDMPVNQKLMARLLERSGLEVTAVDNGAAAIEAALSGSFPFDLILMDIQMPVLDGVEVTRILRSRGCRIPIVALTANATDEQRRECEEAGFDGFLTKPIHRGQLVETLERIAERIDREAGSPAAVRERPPRRPDGSQPTV